jgi:hypothetical protein
MLCVSSVSNAANPPSVLNNSDHLVTVLTNALGVLGIAFSGTEGPSSSVLAVNQTCQTQVEGGSGCLSVFGQEVFLPTGAAIAAALNTSQNEYAADSTALANPSPSVPYQVINQSEAGYTLAGYEQPYYSSIESGSLVYAIAFCGTPTLADYPPIGFATVLPNYASQTPIGTSGCGYAQGIEFSIPADSNPCTSCTWTPISGGGQIDISSPSATTEALSAVLSALKSQHLLWTWGDVKSVLRATASNWSSGYTIHNSSGPSFGYGNINYVAANNYSGKIYLQPPGLSVQVLSSSTAQLAIFPFPTSRRAGEVVYAYSYSPVFPDPSTSNEYTYAQIVALAGKYKGVLVYNSSGRSGVQYSSYSAMTQAPVYFVAFTVDNDSNLSVASYSRGEGYSIQRAMFGSAAFNAINQILLHK